MTEGKELTQAQRAVILALADERTVAGAARKAEVSRSSVYTWLQDPDFRAEVGKVRDHLFMEALDRINGAMDKAVKVLEEMLNHGSARIRLKAASDITRLGMELRERADIEAKVKELEERAKLLGRGHDRA